MINQINSSEWQDKYIWHKEEIFEQAKQMEKKQIIDAFDEGQEYEYEYHVNSAPKFFSDTYYAETYGSKGNDETNSNNVEEVPNVVSPFLEGYEQINQDNPITRGSTALVRITPSQTAVEWLIEQLHAPCRGIPSHIIEQAKQMDKKQHWQTWMDSTHKYSFEIYFRDKYNN